MEFIGMATSMLMTIPKMPVYHVAPTEGPLTQWHKKTRRFSAPGLLWAIQDSNL